MPFQASSINAGLAWGCPAGGRSAGPLRRRVLCVLGRAVGEWLRRVGRCGEREAATRERGCDVQGGDAVGEWLRREGRCGQRGLSGASRDLQDSEAWQRTLRALSPAKPHSSSLTASQHAGPSRARGAIAAKRDDTQPPGFLWRFSSGSPALSAWGDALRRPTMSCGSELRHGRDAAKPRVVRLRQAMKPRRHNSSPGDRVLLRLRCSCAAAALRLRCGCAAAALRLRCGCAAAAVQLRSGCTAAALRLQCGSSAAALRLRCGCVTLRRGGALRRGVAQLSLSLSWLSNAFPHDAGALTPCRRRPAPPRSRRREGVANAAAHPTGPMHPTSPTSPTRPSFRPSGITDQLGTIRLSLGLTQCGETCNGKSGPGDVGTQQAEDRGIGKAGMLSCLRHIFRGRATASLGAPY
eukprot:gene4997-biopygen12582